MLIACLWLISSGILNTIRSFTELSQSLKENSISFFILLRDDCLEVVHTWHHSMYLEQTGFQIITTSPELKHLSFWLSFVEAEAGDYKLVDNNESLNSCNISQPKQRWPPSRQTVHLTSGFYPRSLTRLGSAVNNRK